MIYSLPPNQVSGATQVFHTLMSNLCRTAVVFDSTVAFLHANWRFQNFFLGLLLLGFSQKYSLWHPPPTIEFIIVIDHIKKSSGKNKNDLTTITVHVNNYSVQVRLDFETISLHHLIIFINFKFFFKFRYF